MIKPAISIQDIQKSFGSFKALDHVSIDVADKEFFTLLGPSGCGKTTLLRLIAGFEDVTAGAIFLYGDEIEDLPPNKRPINTVFQQYALFPQMTVIENVGFALQRLGYTRQDTHARAKKMLELVQLQQFSDRLPRQLSGGQQQRVALARALAPEPKVLLLDEPLSALDLKLRQAMRGELKRIQEETGITFIFVTHDQEEALTMSDRIAVMSAGRVQQIGTAREIYDAPDNRFVADFVGETNLMDVTVRGMEQGLATCELRGGGQVRAIPAREVPVGSAGHISIRPERVKLIPANDADLVGVISSEVFLGTSARYDVTLTSGETMAARTDAHRDHAIGSQVGIEIEPGAARLLVD